MVSCLVQTGRITYIVKHKLPACLLIDLVMFKVKFIVRSRQRMC